MTAPDLGAEIAAHHARQASIRAEKAASCPWCDIYVRSSAGLCTCAEACGVITCPARNADGYEPPPVPRFPNPRPKDTT